MKIEFQTANTLAAHAVCVAAGTRDGLRTAQFYVRDMSKADSGNGRRNVAFLSGLVARIARLADRFMTWGANVAIALFLPSWRKLPSPFAPGMMNEVAEAIRKNSLAHNPLFNAYFFRAAIHIIGRYSEPPYLLLEHRVDAARRQLASSETSALSEAEVDFLSRTLLALVEAAPVARVGKPVGSVRLFEDTEPNVAIFAIACVALLFAEEGKPIAIQDEDEFFAIVGALILPRLKDISTLIAKRDVARLSRELAVIKAMY
jgi:hypothetical protein